MAGGLKVSYEEMRIAGGKLTAGQSTIEGELTGLQGVITQLIQEGFTTDTAGPAFESAYSEFTVGVKQVLEGLSGMARYLNAAADTFSEADSQLAAALKK